MKRRLELVDAAKNHNKFWEVEVKGSQMIAHWGRIGTVGQNQVKDFGSPEKAKAAAEKMVAEKKAKGYVPVDGASKKASKGRPRKASKGRASKGKRCERCGRPDGWTQCSHDVSGCKCRECVSMCWGDPVDCANARASKKASKKTSSKSAKKSPKAKSKCAHCGRPSASPTDCPEPWEHDYYKPGCSSGKKVGGKRVCAWCKANAFLTTSEMNWLAKNGWSSDQIRKMSGSPAGRKEARALIKAGKPKKPGSVTEVVSRDLEAKREYRKNLLVAGVVALGPAPQDDITDVQRMILEMANDSPHQSDRDRKVAIAVENGLVCVENGKAMIVAPADLRKSIRSFVAVQLEVARENQAEGSDEADRIKWLKKVLA